MWFIDFEASSLSGASFPIEVGVARLDLETLEVVESHGFLIKPDAAWKDWSKSSQKVHGIEREELENGLPAGEVVIRLNDILGSNPAYCDSMNWDEFWNKRLTQAAQADSTYQIDWIWQPLFTFMANSHASDNDLYELRPQITAILGRPNPHRAEADARLLAEGYRDAVLLVDETMRKSAATAD